MSGRLLDDIVPCRRCKEVSAENRVVSCNYCAQVGPDDVVGGDDVAWNPSMLRRRFLTSLVSSSTMLCRSLVSSDTEIGEEEEEQRMFSIEKKIPE